ncbi:MAG: hypothetical protein RO257_09545 [Candidatus Kapabacteria bacterium]|nr:hypothetical protein [Candidatus Kapabacteria bacterium]
MKIRIFVLLLIFIFYNCTPPKYIVKRQTEIKLSELDNSIVNYIPILDSDLNKSEILHSSYNLIKNEEFSKLKNYLTELEESGTNSSDVFLSKTLLLITNKNYAEASVILKRINDNDFIVLKKLLTIDLEYETAKSRDISDFSGFLAKYQKLIDEFPDNIMLKKIVAIRIRYLRYYY